MAESQDVDALKRRGRRRLVGAIALVLVAVIVLPWIFDPQPRLAPPVSVRIPNEDESTFKPRAAPAPAAVQAAKPPATAPEPKSAAGTEPIPKPAAGTEPAPKPSPAAPARSADSERARAEAALANLAFVVPVGAYADPERVIGKLKAAKIPYFTESVATAKGSVTRVRAGPFQSRAAAERALKQIRALGFKPGEITTRS